MCVYSCREDLPESSYKYQLLGLNLLRLLSENKLAEFHTVITIFTPFNILVMGKEKNVIAL